MLLNGVIRILSFSDLKNSFSLALFDPNIVNVYLKMTVLMRPFQWCYFRLSPIFRREVISVGRHLFHQRWKIFVLLDSDLLLSTSDTRQSQEWTSRSMWT